MRISWGVLGIDGGEGVVDLWEKLTQKVDWHGWGASAEDSNEMVLEGLDGFFRHVAPVFLRGN